MDVHVGRVVRLVRDRGFGFIRDDQDGREYFFHRSGLTQGDHHFDRLKDGRDGTMVEFEIEGKSHKGPRATNVSLIHTT